MRMSKKSLLLSFVVLFFVCVILDFQVAAEEVLRVATWGGSYKESYEEAMSTFEKENNCKIEWFIGSTPDFNVRARFNQVDVVTNSLFYSRIGEKEGLWAGIDEKKIPNMANLYDFAKYSKYTVFSNISDFVLVYNSKYIKTPPTSWNDLWDPAYKNRVVLQHLLSTSTLDLIVQQAKQEGGGIDNIEPGFNRLYDLYKSGNLIALISGTTELQGLFELEEAWIGRMNTGRVLASRAKGFDFLEFVRPKEGSTAMISTLNVVKGTKELDLAMKFINHVLSPETQYIFAKRNYYAPTVTNTKVPLEVEAVMLSEEEFSRLRIIDMDKISVVMDEWAERWDRMITE